MEILLWLVPAVLVTAAAMAWVAWLGREGRGEVDRDEAVARLAAALEGGRSRRSRRRSAPGYAAARPAPDRSTGVAVRPVRGRPAPVPDTTPGTTPAADNVRRTQPDPRRRHPRAS